MMGLEIYNSQGEVTFSPKSKALFLSIKTPSDIPLPPYSTNGTDVYLYDTLRTPPRLIGPEEPYGLQTWTEDGQLQMDPRRRPLTFTNAMRITHKFPGGNSSNIDAATPWYLIGPADGKAVVFLNACYWYETETSAGGFELPSIYARGASVVPDIKIDGGNFFIRILYAYSEYYWESGQVSTYVEPFSLDLVVGLTSVPR